MMKINRIEVPLDWQWKGRARVCCGNCWSKIRCWLAGEKAHRWPMPPSGEEGTDSVNAPAFIRSSDNASLTLRLRVLHRCDMGPNADRARLMKVPAFHFQGVDMQIGNEDVSSRDKDFRICRRQFANDTIIMTKILTM